MSVHCAYCPPANAHSSGDCAYPHAPTINVFGSVAHHAAMLVDSPLLLPMPVNPKAANLRDLWLTQGHVAIVDFHPTPPRPLNLTHCVQLK
jgi:hypothetical protein